MKGGTQVLERGSIYFVYKPKVNEKEVSGLGDVQRFFLILHPDGTHIYRQIVVGHKKLPDLAAHERPYWAVVEQVAQSVEAVEEALRGSSRDTRSQGRREQPPARPAGEGVYEIVRHGSHTHLAYALELPREPGEAQRELGIAREASYVIRVKNPRQAENMSIKPPPDYPAEVMEQAGDELFFSPETPEPLDFEGAELLLIGASQAPQRELGVDLAPADEDERSADILNDLRMRSTEYPKETLFKGEWA